MSDFPGQGLIGASVINPFAPDQPIGGHQVCVGGSASAAAVWPSANRAIYVPFVVYDITTIVQMGFVVGVQSGTMDVGLYTETYARLTSMGSAQSVPAAGVGLMNIPDTTLTPGLYYAGVVVSNTTATFQRSNNYNVEYNHIFPVQQQALGSTVLVDPATPAIMASAYIPLITMVEDSVY